MRLSISSTTVRRGIFIFSIIIVVGGVSVTNLHSYLLFHSIAELFSIVIACGVFMISWNSRERADVHPFVILGIGYLFVAVFDMLHMLSYSGMNIFPTTIDYPTKLWVAGRYLLAVSFLLFAVIVRSKKRLNYAVVFAAYAVATVVLLLTIFLWGIFPLCFVEGVGITLFKRYSEYAVSIVVAVSGLLVYTTAGSLPARVKLLLASSMWVTVASELVFTSYTSSYGVPNLVGHILKIASYYLAYFALIADELRGRVRITEELRSARDRLSESESELIRANAAKDKFISVLAHDLRNPLSGVLTVAELLSHHFDRLESNEVERYCQMIYSGAVHGMELLDHLLAWGRVQTGRVEWRPERFSIKSAINQELEFVQVSAERKHIKLDTQADDEDMFVLADRNMISTVIRNLLVNAIKFSPEGATVRVTAGKSDHRVSVSVQDDGEGMSEETVSQLFRLDQHPTTKGTSGETGTGVGLLLCKDLLEMNKGTISVRSVQGKGSTFTIELPEAEGDSLPGVRVAG